MIDYSEPPTPQSRKLVHATLKSLEAQAMREQMDEDRRELDRIDAELDRIPPGIVRAVGLAILAAIAKMRP